MHLMFRLGTCSLALASLGALLAACGPDDANAPAPAAGTASGSPAERGPFVGQEIWLTYESPPHAHLPIRVKRSREDARALAEELHAKVSRGADVGVLAQLHSNAQGARADGFSGVLPRDPRNPDERDRALMRTRIGGVTGLVDWNGGWWFAKRIALDEARRLEKVFDAQVEAGREALKTRVRARAIVIHYVGAYPDLHDTTDTLDQAKARAERVLAALRAGGDFAKIAKEGLPGEPLAGARDFAGERGGVLLAFDEPGKGGRWIGRYDSGYPDTLLRVLFEAPVGLVPDPIVTARGVVVAEVLERRRVEDHELPPSTKRPP
jgi:hypothetical protein